MALQPELQFSNLKGFWCKDAPGISASVNLEAKHQPQKLTQNYYNDYMALNKMAEYGYYDD